MYNIINKILLKLDLKSILIICLIAVVLLMRTCEGGKPIENGTVDIDGKTYTVLKTEVDTVYEEIVQTVYKPGKTIYVDRPIYVNVPANIDTMEILKDYFASYIYKDTLYLEENLGYIALTDTISQNKIKGRLYDAYVNKMIIDSTIYVLEPPKRQLFVGGQIGMDKENFINFFGPSLVYKTKKDDVYSIGLGYNNNKSVSLMAGMYWKLKLKK